MASGKQQWQMRGAGYEFCNCDYGCGCNFGGFPNSKDGSCHALVGMHIASGVCGTVNLDGVKCAALVKWPKAIHEGNGKCVFIVDPATTDQQVEVLAQIFSGSLGGLPWELLGPTMQVVGLEKAKITISGSGVKSTFHIEGIGEGRGQAFKNPVSGEDHLAVVDLPNGFIWSRGNCGEGSFKARAGELALEYSRTNWIFYEFDWNNAQAAAA
ncbi:MAG TPA: DUF1326 domain-containing protein [Vicinamibacterales bacterium]|nr:DUF1326 domain-containing protein [Vicinamibacterales bacterium]